MSETSVRKTGISRHSQTVTVCANERQMCDIEQDLPSQATVVKPNLDQSLINLTSMQKRRLFSSTTFKLSMCQGRMVVGRVCVLDWAGAQGVGSSEFTTIIYPLVHITRQMFCKQKWKETWNTWPKESSSPFLSSYTYRNTTWTLATKPTAATDPVCSDHALVWIATVWFIQNL